MHKLERLREYNLKRLDYPDLFFAGNQEDQPLSDFQWNTDKFKKCDLLELIAALESVQAIKDGKGRPASFAKLVNLFSRLLNIDLKYAYKERDRILMRKDSTDPFMQILLNEIKD